MRASGRTSHIYNSEKVGGHLKEKPAAPSPELAGRSDAFSAVLASAFGALFHHLRMIKTISKYIRIGLFLFLTLSSLAGGNA